MFTLIFCKLQFFLFFIRFARPSQVFYGGEIKGESAMKHFEDVGSSVVHTFQVNSWLRIRHFYKINYLFIISLQIYNAGPWKAPHVEVYIDWPFQVGNDKPQGKWLLYLEDSPIIEGAGGGICKLIDSSNPINPLKLSRKAQEIMSLHSAPLTDEPLLLRRSNKSYNFAMYQKSSSFEKQSNESSALNRVKRDRAMIIRADKLVDSDGKKTNIVTMVMNFI